MTQTEESYIDVHKFSQIIYLEVELNAVIFFNSLFFLLFFILFVFYTR